MGQSGTLRGSYDRLAPGVDQASLSYRMPITPELALAAGLSHTASTVADTRVSLGLIWTPGAKTANHTRPLGQSLSAKAITQANLDNPYYTPIGIASLGQVVTAVSAQSLVSSTLLSSVATDPAPVAGGAFAALGNMTISDVA